MLNKRHNKICYHRFHEAQAIEFIRVDWIQGGYNQDYLGHNTNLSNKRSYELVNDIMWKDGFTILN